MKTILYKIFFLALLSFSTLIQAELLNEATINKMMNNIDKAIANKNADSIVSYMSNNVEIIMNINMGDKKQVINPTREKYIEMLKQGFAVYKNYEYSRTNVNIRLGSPRKAFVSTDINESMVVNEQVIKGHSKEKIVIDLVEGKPIITKITTYINM